MEINVQYNLPIENILLVLIFYCSCYFRFVKTMPCIAVFMSSLTIVAIALDRYRVIVSSSSKQVILWHFLKGDFWGMASLS